MALIYGASILGAAGVAYMRGRTQVTDMATDAMVHGVIAGTALNVIGWFMLPSGERVPVVASAKTNGVKGLGKLGAEGVKALTNIDADKLYSAMKSSGVKVMEPTAQPSVVVQDAK